MDTLELLTQRFTEAIKKAMPDRTPLIGPKWFQWVGKGTDARFRFIGCEKLAKATKSNPRRVAASIASNLKLDDLNVTVKVSDEAIFVVGPAPDAEAEVGKEAEKTAEKTAEKVAEKKSE